MAITRLVPSAEYLRSASPTSLQSFELAKLNRAANLRREIAVLIGQWMEETAEALLARYMIEHQSSLRQPSVSAAELLQSLENPVATHLSDTSESPTNFVPAPPRLAAHQHRFTGTHGGKSTK